jgi:hypothetical protein
MRYVAGYMKLHHKKLEKGGSEAWTMDGFKTVWINSYEQDTLSKKYNLLRPQKHEGLIAGFIRHNTSINANEYILKLIDEQSDVVLLQKNIGSLYEPHAHFNLVTYRLEINSKSTPTCLFVDLKHYDNAHKLSYDASLNDFIFFVKYDATH